MEVDKNLKNSMMHLIQQKLRITRRMSSALGVYMLDELFKILLPPVELNDIVLDGIW